MNWFQVLLAWLVWAGALDAIDVGNSLDSPPIFVTLGSGKRFLVNFHGVRQA